MLKYSSLAAVASFAIVIASSSTTRAQSQPAGQATRASPGGLEEIIVSARKREESILKTPVLVQAITAEQIENLRINDMYQLGAVTPNLKITVGFASVGAVASLRGLGNGMAANFIDQSVLLNVDGAALSHGSFYRGALFDVAQIEVLKGPQGLFFGKSSSAGIVAVTSADPGEDWDIKATAGAEFEADEWLVDGYVSGPLSDTVGIRVAGYYNEQKGWLRNRNPTNPNDLMPDEENYGGRVTLKFDNDENLVARLKFSTTSNENNAFDGDINQRDCTGDTAQVPAYQPYDDCEINFYVSGNGPSLPYRPDLDYSLGSPNFFIGVPSSLFRDGTGYQWTDTNSALATIDYAITSGLSLASVSAYSDVEAAEAGRSFSPPPVNFFDLGAHYEQDSWSQELRLTSDFDGWFDFMVGGFYGEDESKTRLYLGVPSFTFYTDNDIDLSATTSSLFGQVLLTPLENLELSVGARYTKVKKWATSLYNRDNIPAIFGDPDGEQLGDVPYDNRYFEEDDTSPEVTLTYRPNDEVTAFVSYKQGYKGPGFNANTTATAYNANQVTPFGGENVEGFEGGIKTLLLDRELALTAAAYTYDYENLQVAFVNNVTQTVDVRNGADARVQGVELGATWQPSAIGGLTLNGFVNYNDSEYTSFPAAPCYGGQTEGCVAIAGGGTGQNLKGRTLANAPEWVAQFGLEYTRPIGSALEFGLSFNTNYSSDYLYIPELHPGGVQDDYATYDASLRVGAADRLWEVALIGRNLSNEAVVPCGQDGGTVIPGVASDPIAFVLRSRQVLLQLTMRPGHR